MYNGRQPSIPRPLSSSGTEAATRGEKGPAKSTPEVESPIGRPILLYHGKGKVEKVLGWTT